jgi:hypothetical protein
MPLRDELAQQEPVPEHPPDFLFLRNRIGETYPEVDLSA